VAPAGIVDAAARIADAAAAVNSRPTDLDTRSKLVAAAAHLFARRGIESVPLRDVGELAGQRNASVVQYYFGGRWDLVAAVFDWQTTEVTAPEPLDPAASVAEILEHFIDQVAAGLRTPGGRDFLRILFEVMARFPSRFREGAPGFHEWTSAVERMVAALDQLPPAIARARAVAMSQMVIHQMAARARAIDDGGHLALDDGAFIANLQAMAAGMLTAVSGKDPPPTTAL
jgi:AcrR family transcriptional regulator